MEPTWKNRVCCGALDTVAWLEHAARDVKTRRLRKRACVKPAPGAGEQRAGSLW